ncbi:type II secretion system protein [Paraburkholderia azotifigens]|uniref:type II secretion system protein n=1 Tax=Paraburkholderia azotifigens TaxID=2057004 RepID=UPI0004BA784B
MVNVSTSAVHQRGVTYFWTLFILTLVSLALGKLLEDVRTTSQRVREVELLYVGNLYRHAIQQYWQSTPLGEKRYPARLDDLLRDPRYPVTRRYLRRLYPDPVTGKSFAVVVAPEGGIMGVHSVSAQQPIKVAGFSGNTAGFARAGGYDKWEFVYVP